MHSLRSRRNFPSAHTPLRISKARVLWYHRTSWSDRWRGRFQQKLLRGRTDTRWASNRKLKNELRRARMSSSANYYAGGTNREGSARRYLRTLRINFTAAAKKTKHRQACNDRRADFSPLVCSSDGAVHREGVHVMKKVAARLAEKWESNYTVQSDNVLCPAATVRCYSSGLCTLCAGCPKEACPTSLSWTMGPLCPFFHKFVLFWAFDFCLPWCFCSSFLMIKFCFSFYLFMPFNVVDVLIVFLLYIL